MRFGQTKAPQAGSLVPVQWCSIWWMVRISEVFRECAFDWPLAGGSFVAAKDIKSVLRKVARCSMKLLFEKRTSGN
jgi:hypothetical protein